MRPTRRGWAALVLATVAVILAGAHGPRALNAVAAPLYGAVAFGVVQVWRADRPTITCQSVEPGFPGAERSFRAEVTGGVLEVTHGWPDGLDGEGIDTVVAGPSTVETDLILRDRGRYEVRVPTIRQRDALGLVYASHDTDATTTIVVYPEIHRGADPDIIGGLVGADALAERQEFDRLREYVPGDPLRDIHWKSSAKSEGFVVAEYEPGERTEAITVAATAEPGAVDAMATAAGTMAVLALESGLSVGLRLPDREIPPGAGRDHEATILSALAAATHGSVDASEADVTVHATAATTTVTVGDTTHQFQDALGEAGSTPTEGVATA